jgi:zinc transport system ATP-binding protein
LRGPAIVFDKVALNLGGVSILHDVSMRVEPGELACVVGPNGGGKTSLIRCTLGQMPHKGSIRFESDGAIRTGYVPQFLEIDRTLPLTVTNVLSIMIQRKPAFFGVKRENATQIEAALTRAGFHGKRNRKFGGLSGGERQRVLFAQALMPEPNLLILDEPTSNMDEAGAYHIEDVVREMNALGTTVLWINHDLSQVKRIAQKIIVVDRTVVYAVPVAGLPPDIAESRAGIST